MERIGSGVRELLGVGSSAGRPGGSKRRLNAPPKGGHFATPEGGRALFEQTGVFDGQSKGVLSRNPSLGAVGGANEWRPPRVAV